mmetsp:Transcript_1171/g.3247  ORF Transcript_1171/g.3247 Transcript_1171/m.3247 type:complete len:227 (+) Transcript_1171:179-859(+)
MRPSGGSLTETRASKWVTRTSCHSALRSREGKVRTLLRTTARRLWLCFRPNRASLWPRRDPTSWEHVPPSPLDPRRSVLGASRPRSSRTRWMTRAWLSSRNGAVWRLSMVSSSSRRRRRQPCARIRRAPRTHSRPNCPPPATTQPPQARPSASVPGTLVRKRRGAARSLPCTPPRRSRLRRTQSLSPSSSLWTGVSSSPCTTLLEPDPRWMSLPSRLCGTRESASY